MYDCAVVYVHFFCLFVLIHSVLIIPSLSKRNFSKFQATSVLVTGDQVVTVVESNPPRGRISASLSSQPFPLVSPFCSFVRTTYIDMLFTLHYREMNCGVLIVTRRDRFESNSRIHYRYEYKERRFSTWVRERYREGTGRILLVSIAFFCTYLLGLVGF